MEETIHSMSATIPGTELYIEGRISRPPMEPTKQNQALWKTVKMLGESLGYKLENGLAGGASDGNTLSQYTATLDGMGAVGDGAHAPHEFLYIDKMVERTALLALMLMLPAESSIESTLFFDEPTRSLEEYQ